MRVLNHHCIAVIITSDKVYNNIEKIVGYKENDELSKDIYSGSKGSAELIIKSYYESFLKIIFKSTFSCYRAGNVIGGGDWAKDRVIADAITLSNNKIVEIRSPKATRPWQHVLEPLSDIFEFRYAVK